MKNEPEQNNIKVKRKLGGQDLFFLVALGLIAPLMVILLTIYGVFVTGSIEALIVPVAIILLWRYWYLFMKKATQGMNDPDQMRIMDQQIKLLSRMDSKTFEINKSDDEYFLGKEGRVMAAASRFGGIAVVLIGIVYIIPYIGKLSYKTQQDTILIVGYVVIIGFIFSVVRAQKEKK